MTWSVIARDEKTGAFGVAVTTKFFAVGSLCPHAMGRVGALATQALINPMYGVQGMAMLRDGVSAPDVVSRLIGADAGSATRQLHVIDAAGRIAAHTGADCIDWAGHRVGPTFSVAGNMLAGPDVVGKTYESFAANAAKPLAERFIDALDAGQAVGGDKRGKQSAALIIYEGQDYPCLSLRVDDHEEPLAELRRLYRMSLGRFAAFVTIMATRENPTGIFDRNVLEAEVARREALLAKGLPV